MGVGWKWIGPEASETVQGIRKDLAACKKEGRRIIQHDHIPSANIAEI